MPASHRAEQRAHVNATAASHVEPPPPWHRRRAPQRVGLAARGFPQPRLSEDLRRYWTETPGKPALHRLVKIPAVRAIAVYRFGQWVRAGATPLAGLLRRPLWPAYLLLRWAVRQDSGIDIHPDAHIGPGLYIGHFGGVWIGPCRMGSCCSVHQHVRIGPEGPGDGPVIGPRAWIGPHARVVGSLQIGEGATVSACSQVTADVAPRQCVLGRPARTLMRDYDNAPLLCLPPDPPGDDVVAPRAPSE